MAAGNFYQFINNLNSNSKYIATGVIAGGLVLGLGIWAKGINSNHSLGIA